MLHYALRLVIKEPQQRMSLVMEGLILNGGQAQAGDAINSVVSGFMHVTAASSLTTSGPGGGFGYAKPSGDRHAHFHQFTANIDGNGLLTLMNGKTSISSSIITRVAGF